MEIYTPASSIDNARYTLKHVQLGEVDENNQGRVGGNFRNLRVKNSEEFYINKKSDLPIMGLYQ